MSRRLEDNRGLATAVKSAVRNTMNYTIGPEYKPAQPNSFQASLAEFGFILQKPYQHLVEQNNQAKDANWRMGQELSERLRHGLVPNINIFDIDFTITDDNAMEVSADFTETMALIRSEGAFVFTDTSRPQGRVVGIKGLEVDLYGSGEGARLTHPDHLDEPMYEHLIDNQKLENYLTHKLLPAWTVKYPKMGFESVDTPLWMETSGPNGSLVILPEDTSQEDNLEAETGFEKVPKRIYELCKSYYKNSGTVTLLPMSKSEEFLELQQGMRSTNYFVPRLSHYIKESYTDEDGNYQSWTSAFTSVRKELDGGRMIEKITTIADVLRFAVIPEGITIPINFYADGVTDKEMMIAAGWLQELFGDKVQVRVIVVGKNQADYKLEKANNEIQVANEDQRAIDADYEGKPLLTKDSPEYSQWVMNDQNTYRRMINEWLPEMQSSLNKQNSQAEWMREILRLSKDQNPRLYRKLTNRWSPELNKRRGQRKMEVYYLTDYTQTPKMMRALHQIDKTTLENNPHSRLHRLKRKAA